MRHKNKKANPGRFAERATTVYSGWPELHRDHCFNRHLCPKKMTLNVILGIFRMLTANMIKAILSSQFDWPCHIFRETLSSGEQPYDYCHF